MNRDNMMHIDDPDAEDALTKHFKKFEDGTEPGDKLREQFAAAVNERRSPIAKPVEISTEEIARIGIKEKHVIRTDHIPNVIAETGQVFSVGVDMGRGPSEAVELVVAELNDGRFVVMDDRRVTADELRATSARLEAKARKSGIDVDFSGIDHEALARETNNRDRDVLGWSPPPPPPSWLESERDIRGAKYRNPNRRLVVILSCAIEDDGRAWLHLSVSHSQRIPTWGELGLVKEAFLGDREAYQVLPPKKRYVNIHPHVLNLFAPLEEPVLPDFTRGTGGI